MLLVMSVWGHLYATKLPIYQCVQHSIEVCPGLMRRCMAVVEVIMLERMLDGVIKGRYSLGWALLPLFKVRQPDPHVFCNVSTQWHSMLSKL